MYSKCLGLTPQFHHDQAAQEDLLKASALTREECLHIDQNVYVIEAVNNNRLICILLVGYITGHLLVTPSAKISDILQHDDKMRILM